MAPPWRAEGSGVLLFVRVTPRGGRDAIGAVETLADGTMVLKVRVRAAPEDGAANLAVARLLANALSLPVSAVSLAAGASARRKTLRLSGDPDALVPALAALTGTPPR